MTKLIFALLIVSTFALGQSEWENSPSEWEAASATIPSLFRSVSNVRMNSGLRIVMSNHVQQIGGSTRAGRKRIEVPLTVSGKGLSRFRSAVDLNDERYRRHKTKKGAIPSHSYKVYRGK